MFGFKSKEEKEAIRYQQIPLKFTTVLNDSNSVPTEETKNIMNKVFNNIEIQYNENFTNIFLTTLTKKEAVKKIYFSFGIDSICEKINALLYKRGINIKLLSEQFTKNDSELIRTRREQFKGTVVYDLNQINEYLKTQGYEIVCFEGTTRTPNGGLAVNEPRYITIVPKN